MANHDSRKRAAGREPVGKRALSLLMALVMSLSLVQISAFAADDTVQKVDQVMNNVFVVDENGVIKQNEDGTPADVEKIQDGFTVSKQITKQLEENLFEVQLQVKTTQTVTTSDAAVQLVIDTSGSMAYCAVCGKEKCKHDAGSRLQATKAAVTGKGGFLDQLLAGNKSGGKIWVSVAEFADGAYTVCDWTDIRTSKGLQDVKKAVNDLKAGGGTNLEAAMMLARNRLKMDAVASAASKYTVLLTDGKPTYRVTKDFTRTDEIDSDTTDDGSGTSCSKSERNEAKDMATQVKALSKLYTICYGAQKDKIRYDVCKHCQKGIEEHNEKYEGGFPFGGYEYYCNGTSGATYQKETKPVEIEVGTFLETEIATPKDTSVTPNIQYAFNASETAEVNNAFKNIATSTVEGMNGAGTKVIDPMGQYMQLAP